MDKDTMKLIKKIGEAEGILKGRSRKNHSSSCHSEDMTGHPAACNCGARESNGPSERIANALRVLSLDDL